ncbi:MAG: HEAT repeat domain-containing protein, partial [Cyanobacteria bacterium P01_F01_bin.116]
MKPRSPQIPLKILLLTCLSFGILGLTSVIYPRFAVASTCTGNNVQSVLGDFYSQSTDEKLQLIKQLTHAAYPPPLQKQILCTFIEIANNEQQPVSVRRNAINAIGGIGTGAEEALPDLKAIFKNRQNSNEIRRGILKNLPRIDAQLALDELIWALDDPDFGVRTFAIHGLEGIGPDAQKAVPKLYDILHNDLNEEVRADTAIVLTALAEKDAELVKHLGQALGDPAFFVRRSAVKGIGRIGPDAQSAIPQLQIALTDANYTLRSAAATALGSMGTAAQPAIPDLQKALQDSNWRVRGHSAMALSTIGAGDVKTIEALIAQLQDSSAFVRAKTMEALRQLDRDLETNLDAGEFNLTQAIGFYKQVLEQAQDPALGFSENDVTDVSRRLRMLEARRYQHVIVKNALTNPWVWLGTLYGIAHLGIFWLRPLWLLQLDRILQPLGFKLPLLGTEISARWLFFSRYYPRVLDAWVASYLPIAKENFRQKETVRERHIHIPTAIVLNRRNVGDLSGKDLQTRFKKHLLIVGEGGSGKTSLACQIAKWAMSDDAQQRIAPYPMLPVLIENELEAQEASNNPLIEAIQGQLEDLTNAFSPVSEELLTELLKRRRLLIIVDHLSEMTEATRKQIRPDLPSFAINALIVTSRDEELLNTVTKTVIKPMRIEGNHIASFMEAYLTSLAKRDLFTDSEFFAACSRLSTMVGTRNITPLLAKLYAEELVAAKVDAAKEFMPQLPSNIPDLMLYYINELNRIVHDNKLDDRVLHQDAEKIAWECVKSTYSPVPAKRDTVLAAIGGDDASRRLDYLEHCLHLIQTISPAEDQIRFALDPLAEYLAGLYLVNQYGSNQKAWHQLINDLHHIPETPNAIAGFLMAVRDCCVAKGS